MGNTFREVKCYKCGHIFMWQKDGIEYQSEYRLESTSELLGRALALFLTLANPCKPLFFGHLSLLHSFILFANLLPKSSQKVVFPPKK